MNVSDYIVSFLINRGVEHVYGYQGTMIAYLVDALCKNRGICNHFCYNEQAAAFATCGHSKTANNGKR